MIPCPVCGVLAELMHQWLEGPRNDKTGRAIVRCLNNHWVALDVDEYQCRLVEYEETWGGDEPS